VDVAFAVDEHTRRCLLEGLDHIGLTLAHEDRIAAYEASRASWRPVVPVPAAG
jgi:3-isopropylmalate/(R)-2-methylmalate dehydratase small subunit